ncbi:prepilin-type N-terminal cleavage/methylation domain-containing protein [Campylobacter sp. RM12920]|uniref:Prepilin-type N-terminal cleavage/methylation domain-containing protein n=1 Tax=Campylobacter californiensis TaxID=1032243 RepID=A0ABD4JJ25_9BACT|nr:prepilin-type N-terminal cleavage/methylation domain-containing protein [Campylobacter sp. RM12919]MBE2987715.1 prepilin-type N-terminal cleavage/methylation domain-containing protein [Campylobacter sp. RM12920]
MRATKKAFTLIELIIVIVVLGIVGLMTLQVTTTVFKNYVQSKAMNSLQTQTELVLEQISKMLSYRIKESVIARKGTSSNILPLNNDQVNNEYTTLEFITYAREMFNDGIYSGFADLEPSSKANGLITPGSKLSSLNQENGILDDFGVAITDLAVIFKGLAYDTTTSFGYNNTNSLDVAKITSVEDNKIHLTHDGEISEQYHIAYSAYAIAVSDESEQRGDFTLKLYYNYQPWLGEKFQNADSAILAENVTRFNFTEQNGVVVIKLCMHEAGKSGLMFDKNFDFTVCKSKAIY